MKNNNRNIDEIFEKARNLKPEVSKDEIHNLISDDAFIKNYQIKKKNFKGAKTMYIFAGAFSIAAIIGGLTFSTLTVPEKTYNTKKEINTVIADNSTNTHDSKPILNSATLPPKDNNDVRAKNNSNEELPVSSQKPEKFGKIGDEGTFSQDEEALKIDGLKVIELNQKQLDNLGISVDKDGKFIEVYMYMDKNIPIKQKIFVDWGVGFDENDSHTLPKNSKIIMPNFISDNSGNRRIQVFNNDDDNGVMITDTHEKKFSCDNYLKFDIKNLSNSNTFTSENNSNIDIKTSMTLINDEDNKVIDSLISHFGMIDNDGKLSCDNKKIIVMNINDPNMSSQQMDSLNSCKIVKKIFIKNDSTCSQNLKIPEPINIDSILKICYENNILNSDGTINIDMNKTVDNITLVDDLFSKKLLKLNFKIDQFNQKIVNKLIPVAVPVPNATDRNGKPLKDFKFILWFEPNEDFLSELPEDICSQIDNELELLKQNGESCSNTPITGKDTYLGVWQGCSGAIENLKVYPNPTDGPIAVDLMLREKRNLTISLLDLTGRKIKDLSTNINAGAGEFNNRYELTKIEPGVYLVVVQSEIGERAVQRVIIGK